MLVNTQRDTDIVAVSNRTAPEEDKESWTREKALERNKTKLQEKDEETAPEYLDTVETLHEKILSMSQQGTERKPKNTEESGKKLCCNKRKNNKKEARR